jgi:(S)-ureidoglycine aminohydrolase
MKMKTFLSILLIALVNLSFGQSGTVRSGLHRWITPQAPFERVLFGNTTFLKDFEVAIGKMKPGEIQVPTTAMSRYEVLLIVKEGELTFSWEGKPTSIGTGSILFLVPGFNQIENRGTSDVVFYRLQYLSKSGSELTPGKSSGGSFFVDWDKLEMKKTNVGGRRDFFNKATTATARFEMHVTTLNEGLPSHAPHEHDEEEIILLMKGAATMTVAGKEYQMVPGDFVFAASHDFHGIRNSGSGQCEYFAFQWK